MVLGVSLREGNLHTSPGAHGFVGLVTKDARQARSLSYAEVEKLARMRDKSQGGPTDGAGSSVTGCRASRPRDNPRADYNWQRAKDVGELGLRSKRLRRIEPNKYENLDSAKSDDSLARSMVNSWVDRSAGLVAAGSSRRNGPPGRCLDGSSSLAENVLPTWCRSTLPNPSSSARKRLSLDP